MLGAIAVQELLRHQGDVVSPLPQRRHLDDHDGQAKVEVLAKLPAGDHSCRFLFVAAITRVSLWISCRPPTRWKRLSCRKRRSFTWTDGGRSPISSRNSVPPAADFDVSFALRVRAGEGAFLVAEEFALQQVLRNGIAVDGDERAVSCALRRWSACATISLPVPLSPRISTGAVVGATLRMKLKTDCICGLAPSMSSKTRAAAALVCRAIFLLELRDVDAALQHEPELVHVHRLAQEIVRAGADGTKRVLLVALAGDDDHLGQRIIASSRRQHRQAFVGFVGARRQSQVEQR